MVTSFNADVKPHQALNIYEILENIFLHLDQSSNATNARVCKLWSDAALDNIWRVITDIECITQLLQPANGPAGYWDTIVCRFTKSCLLSRFEQSSK